MKTKIIQKNLIDRKEVSVSRIKKAIDILYGYDWMLENPDKCFIEEEVTRQVLDEGLLRLNVFVCPKFETLALFSENPEEYMPEKVDIRDLFEPRIKKIRQLCCDLQKIGIITEPNIIIGDNDAEVYIFPFLNDISIDIGAMRSRQLTYLGNFERRIVKNVSKDGIVWSLADLEVLPDSVPVITPDQIEKERKFFKWLFSDDGPYKGRLKFPENVIDQMIKLKYALYGEQGKFLSGLGGVLLQTEGPGVWLERTQMLRCTGSKAIPAIYPWIREEELKKM